MDVKGTGRASQDVSITSMLVQVAIAKNAENRELLEKPVREDSPKVKQAESPSKNDSTNSKTNVEGTKPVADPTKIVDVSV